MNQIKFFELLKRGESPHVEFKKDFPKQVDNLCKTMVAFANCGGGTLLIGINDDGEIIGFPTAKVADEKMQTLAKLARSCSPPLLRV